ncbi:MAG TPA: hypothetical protein P5235_08430 [Saprospiraceae bacterium]|nr:hypothetical protein [Saprospiraceae bacterium]MCB9329101.1 hypothetical protein [Lewinellaceae bacterium]HRX29400.1 hypothetical protein [Saprospiraceae bacterium]
MKTFYLIFTLLLLLFACKEQNVEFKSSDFEKIEFGNGLPYHFSAFILDTIHQFPNYKAAWEFSNIGDIVQTQKMWDLDNYPKQELDSINFKYFKSYSRVDALEYILDKARDSRVLIINEAHHKPQHRVFTTLLLPRLRELGYRHIGFEALSRNFSMDSITEINRFPTFKQGFYIREPQFGNLLRTAFENNYRVFPYESVSVRTSREREINQAKNIQEYIEKYPDDKFVIHCGFDHAYEGEMGGSWEKAMAGRLTEFTGIDPLTIDQVRYSECSERKFENPFYQVTDNMFPSVYVNENDKVFMDLKGESRCDIAVFHPRSKQFIRPQWLTYGDRKEVKMSFLEADIECPCLVFAYKEGEEIDVAVPYDIQETLDKKVTLILDTSAFEIVIWNDANQALKTTFRRSN